MKKIISTSALILVCFYVKAQTSNTIKPITLFEDSINGVHLPFKRKNMTSELKVAFKGFDVTKETVESMNGSGPMYTIKKGGKDFVYILMNPDDTFRIQEINIQNKIIKDVYGVSIGDTYEQIKMKRKGKINYHTESYEMRHTFCHLNNSNISYRMVGETNIPDENPNFQLSEEQIKTWRVSDIFWEEKKVEITKPVEKFDGFSQEATSNALKKITTTQLFDQSNPSVYKKQKTTFTFSEKKVTVGDKIYIVIKHTMNEWGTNIFKTTDDKGKIFIWSYGVNSQGIPFVQCEAAGIDIMYSDSF